MTDDINLDLADLRAKAEAATPGEWRAGVNDTDCVFSDIHNQSLMAPDFGRVLLRTNHHFPAFEADARFIAAANPAVVLALLDRLAAAEAELDRLRSSPARVACSERMPRANVAVLLIGRDWPSPVVSKLIVDNLDGTPTCFSDSDGSGEIFYLDDVSHWMPLPEKKP